MSSEATRSELVVDVHGSAASFVEERTGEAPPNVHAALRYAGVVATLVDASRGAQMIVDPVIVVRGGD